MNVTKKIPKVSLRYLIFYFALIIQLIYYSSSSFVFFTTKKTPPARMMITPSPTNNQIGSVPVLGSDDVPFTSPPSSSTSTFPNGVSFSRMITSSGVNVVSS